MAERPDDLFREMDATTPGADDCPYPYGHAYRKPWLDGYNAHIRESMEGLLARRSRAD